jgi:cytochrome c551
MNEFVATNRTRRAASETRVLKFGGFQTRPRVSYTRAVFQRLDQSYSPAGVLNRMKLFKLALVTFALLSFAAACNDNTDTKTANTNAGAANTNAAKPTASTPAATPDELADARSTYKDNCTRCHKDDGSGGTFEEQGLKPLKVPSLKSDHAVKRTDTQLANKIQTGGGGMPAFKTKLDQQKIDALVRLIRHDFQNNTAAAGPSASPAH